MMNSKLKGVFAAAAVTVAAFAVPAAMAGPAAADSHMSVRAGDKHTPVRAGDNHTPVPAGDNHTPVSAGDNHQPVRAGDNHQPVRLFAGQGQAQCIAYLKAHHYIVGPNAKAACAWKAGREVPFNPDIRCQAGLIALGVSNEDAEFACIRA
ncbi:hypothetical protein ACFW1M_02595 [Streptomyces inhibens]|uniref:hypothetical protein n=1 Tax=Streptomyces inhibens TaxID=2293571 RepID=UPI003694D435